MTQASAIIKSVRKITLIFAFCASFVLVSFHWAIARETLLAAVRSPSPMNAEASSSGICLLERRILQEGLVNVQMLDPSIRVDLKYASAHNFMKKNVYGDLTRAYLRPEAASKLVEASAILQERHPELRLLVVDAVRPRSVQHSMWKILVDTPMQRYVANPHHGSMHNYGTAVDVTLYNIETGKRLDMGTPVDCFDPLAHPNLESKFLREGKLNADQIENRLILRNAMSDAGWRVLSIEWWHFDAFSTDYTRRTYSIIE
jgi:zinc D-Ala-D-Ala dipeptidase